MFESNQGQYQQGEDVNVVDIDSGLRAYVLSKYNHENSSFFYNYATLVKTYTLIDRIASYSDIDQMMPNIAKNTYTFIHLANIGNSSVSETDVFKLIEEYFEGRESDSKEELKSWIAAYFDAKGNSVNRLINDAVNAINYLDEIEGRMKLLRYEWKRDKVRNLKSDLDWESMILHLLSNVRFYFPYSKIHFEQLLAKNIIRQEKKIYKLSQKIKLNDYGPDVLFEKMDDSNIARGVQTYFRTAYRNHINLSSIADNKAHIMISVNSILISVLISLMTYNSITDSKPILLLPILVFLISGVASLIFAVISARPKIISPRRDPSESMSFFSSFSHLTEDEFDEKMDNMLRSGKLLYTNMSKGLYDLGNLIDKKYYYLKYAYNIFMFGFVTTVFLFIIAFFS